MIDRATATPIALHPSVPLDDDAPLTDIEAAVVRALVAVIVREIRDAEAIAASTSAEGRQIIPEIVPTLASLAADINREHVEVRRCATQSLEHAKRAGELLQQVKATLPHGAWLPWLVEHCEVSPRTAQAYMRIAAAWPTLLTKTQRVADLPVRRALALLESPTTTTENVPRPFYFGARKKQDQSNRIVEHSVTSVRDAADLLVLEIDPTALDEACLTEWATELRTAARKLTTFAARLERAQATSIRRVG